MQSYIAVGISLPREIIEKIDVARGDVPRSRFLLRILERVYCINNDNNRKSVNKNGKNRQDSPDIRFQGLADESEGPKQ
ncbi:MAG: hypothetical protein DLM72_05340 [Candidatus Nitrosopolaris wilkensis]|nr:MAG: hypothetical protein DLM72_05340 [Candidatus Nitrosopolaris wilkensis]